MTDISVHVVVTGLVQGVGFRPFIYRIATRFQLTGWVINTNENVKIQLNGSKQNIESFLLALREESPVAAVLDTLSIIDIETTTAVNFSIQGSHDISAEITEISPDIAVCDECLEDIHETGKRMDYSFVNCTNCGPRFTILQDLPYDRPRTTMKSFEMCPECRSEYENVSDRRFHAQPIACNHCGPKYELYIGQNHISQDIADVIHELSFQIDNGGIVLMKGLGGMHLACDAFNEISITKLRELKNREGKPFAVMFRDLHTLKHYAEVSPEEEQALTSWRRPIVLLEKKKDSAQKPLAAGLNACLSLLGVMLPYMPLHYQLFQSLKTPAMVLTSGNFSKEPILVDNDKAKAQFSQKVDAIVLHNREIHNRTDDSVVRVMGGKERVFRRSRSFAPAPVRTALNTEGIIAFGAELSNCFCVGKGKKAFMSQHIGDLQDLETALFYEETITLFKQLFRVKTSMVSVDMHPSYISTQCGIQMRDLPITLVQHHHAHIASCMAEHKLDETVIGVAFDGTGYGTDGNSWGSEFFICDLLDFQRISHFDYIPLPGGDLAMEEPWRVAISYLYKVYGRNFLQLELPFMKRIDPEKIRLILEMIEKKINCPLSSGAGRLFDAVAGLLNLVSIASFQAEGPMRLESIVNKDITDRYSFTSDNSIHFEETIKQIVDDLIKGMDIPTIATKFHNTIIYVIFESVKAIWEKEGIRKVVLSGGVFQNKYLLEGTTLLLQKNNFDVYSHATVPANDGGIALGQLAVAAKRRE